MVLGEAEILGQLRRAHELSREAGTCGPLLDRLVRDALGAGRRARAGTGIARAGVSVSSAAVELAREALGSLADRRVTLVGAGKSGEVTARVLRSHGVRVLRVANRTPERAAELARRYGAEVARRPRGAARRRRPRPRRDRLPARPRRPRPRSSARSRVATDGRS